MMANSDDKFIIFQHDPVHMQQTSIDPAQQLRMFVEELELEAKILPIPNRAPVSFWFCFILQSLKSFVTGTLP